MVDAVTKLTDATGIKDLPQLLAGMVRLVDQTPVIERGYCEVSKKFLWIMKPAAHAVDRLIKARNQHALHADSWKSFTNSLRPVNGAMNSETSRSNSHVWFLIGSN